MPKPSAELCYGPRHRCPTATGTLHSHPVIPHLLPRHLHSLHATSHSPRVTASVHRSRRPCLACHQNQRSLGLALIYGDSVSTPGVLPLLGGFFSPPLRRPPWVLAATRRSCRVVAALSLLRWSRCMVVVGPTMRRRKVMKGGRLFAFGNPSNPKCILGLHSLFEFVYLPLKYCAQDILGMDHVMHILLNFLYFSLF